MLTAVSNCQTQVQSCSHIVWYASLVHCAMAAMVKGELMCKSANVSTGRGANGHMVVRITSRRPRRKNIPSLLGGNGHTCARKGGADHVLLCFVEADSMNGSRTGSKLQPSSHPYCLFDVMPSHGMAHYIGHAVTS